MTTPQLNTMLDSAKFEIFLHPGEGAFLGSLMCSMDITWNTKIKTAQTDGLTMEINPDWFSSIPELTRPTILMHELRHIGYLHPLRAQGLNHKKFNWAADFVINLQLKDEGYSFDGVSPLLDSVFRNMTAEEVYDLLPDPPPSGGGSGGQGKPGTGPVKQAGCWSNDPDDQDLVEPDDPAKIEEIVQAVHAAAMAQQRTGYSSKEVEAISEMIRKRNQPVVNWKSELKDFAQDKAKSGLNYSKRNRRYNHVILPARGKRGRLMEMDFFFDVSGSVTTGMEEQMLAEISFIHGVLKPKALNLIQFDTRIQKVQTFTPGASLEQIEIVGRGGTSLECVAKYLKKSRPAGAVVMTDLDCPIMSHVEGIPILWLCINNPGATVNQGKLIHIQVAH
jgi:predicted metal-dependent peptidase